VGSFSAAARELSLSKSLVSERVKQLEERAGARLLERTTRKQKLTELGSEVLAAATRVEDTLDQLSRSLDDARREPSGLLRVSTTNDLGPLLVGPVARALRGRASPGRASPSSPRTRRATCSATKWTSPSASARRRPRPWSFASSPR
jgi:DNA-binding transcriptional LysR family regulator